MDLAVVIDRTRCAPRLGRRSCWQEASPGLDEVGIGVLRTVWTSPWPSSSMTSITVSSERLSPGPPYRCFIVRLRWRLGRLRGPTVLGALAQKDPWPCVRDSHSMVLDFTINAGDLLLVVLGAGGGVAVSRGAALHRLHVDKRVELHEWALDIERRIVTTSDEVNIHADGKRLHNKSRWSVFELIEDTVGLLPLLDRLAFARLEQRQTNRDYAGSADFRDFAEFMSKRLRVSIPARWWVLRRSPSIYWSAVRRGVRRYQHSRRWR